MAQPVRKARASLQELKSGCDFTCIQPPISFSGNETSPEKLTKEIFEHLLRNNETLQIALEAYSGQISVHAHAHKLFASKFQLVPKENGSQTPLKAVTIFSSVSRASCRSARIWKDPQTQQWETDVEYVEGFPPAAELATAVRDFERFSETFNLFTDSAYVAGVMWRAEKDIHKISNQTLFELLSKLIYAVSHQEHSYFVMHVRSHTNLPGLITEGNQQADSLAATTAAELARLPDIFQ